jgi:hypothetical protein
MPFEPLPASVLFGLGWWLLVMLVAVMERPMDNVLRAHMQGKCPAWNDEPNPEATGGSGNR